MKTPSWALEIKKKYKSAVANSFIVSGNIGDYVDGRMLLKWWLYTYLIDELNFANIVEFNPAKGPFKVSGGIDVGDSFESFCSAMSTDDKTAFIITYPEFVVPGDNYNFIENIVSLHQALNSDVFLSSDNMVIMLTESARSINDMFFSSNSKTAYIDIPLPDEETRLDFINSIFESDEVTLSRVKMEIDKKAFASITSGLSLSNIDDIIMVAESAGALTRPLVIERKKELIHKEFGEVIEILDTEGYGLDRFAGQDHLKAYFKEVIIDAIAAGDTAIVPKGVLLMGPPGTGKTYFSRCLAADAGINFVEFKMSKILGKYVGESEKHMEKALSVFRALAPVGVFMDEIDQTFSRNEDGSGHSVTKNLFGMLLAEMSKPENRGKIVWLGATNFPNNIDEALKRPGRFDKKVPFFAPNFEDRKTVFKIQLKGKNPADDIDYDFLSKSTDGFTQAEIEGIVLKAVELAHRDKANTDNKLHHKYFESALKYITTAKNAKIQNMVNIALREVNDLEFVPEEYMSLYRQIHDAYENDIEDPADSVVAEDVLDILKKHVVNKKKSR